MFAVLISLIDVKSKMKILNITNFSKKYRPGVLLTILACFLYAVSTVLSASIVQKIGASYVSASRYIVQGLLMIPLILKKPESISQPTLKQWVFVTASALSIGIGAYLGYVSLIHIPVVDFTVIVNCQPVIVFIMSSIWLKERVTLTDIIMLISVLIGVVLVCQPTFIFGTKNLEDFGGLRLSWQGYVFSLVTCFGSSLTLVIMKRVQSVGPTFILVVQSIVVSTLMLILASILKDSRDPQTVIQLVLMLSSSLLSSCARGLITASVMFEDSTIISVFCCCEIIFSLILQILFLSIYPNIPSIFGAILVVIGVIGILMKKQLRRFFSEKIKYLQNESHEEKISIIK